MEPKFKIGDKIQVFKDTPSMKAEFTISEVILNQNGYSYGWIIFENKKWTVSEEDIINYGQII